MPLGLGYMCPTCRGFGKVFGSDDEPVDCPQCGGEGTLEEPPEKPKKEDDDE
jgi:DnaJ-class molecular chaperone